jgi:hypothetical protein
MQSFYDVDSILELLAEEALAPLIQPDNVASAEYFKIYEKTTGLEPERKLMLAVLQDAIRCFQNFLFATDKRWKEMLNQAEEWFNERGNERIFSIREYL